MTDPSSEVIEAVALGDDEAEAAFIALVTMLDRLGCCPAANVAAKDDGGVSFSLHFSADRARKLAAHTPALEKEGWRPIETAPKDGTRILLCDTEIDRWVCSGRFFYTEVNDGLWVDDADSVIDEQPTNWRPLPDPPALQPNDPIVQSKEL